MSASLSLKDPSSMHYMSASLSLKIRPSMHYMSASLSIYQPSRSRRSSHETSQNSEKQSQNILSALIYMPDPKGLELAVC